MEDVGEERDGEVEGVREGRDIGGREECEGVAVCANDTCLCAHVFVTPPLPFLQLQREAQAAIAPKEMFLLQKDKYSSFNDQGIPTADAKGNPLSDKQLKKLTKEWEEQKKRYESRLTQN